MDKFDEKMDDWIQKVDSLARENPQVGAIYEFVSDLYDRMDDDADSEVDCIEIDDVEYIVFKEFSIDEDTYYYLVSTEDPTDVMFRKRLVEDGEEYMVGLDDEEEFDLAFLYLQKLMLTDIKSIQAKLDADHPTDSEKE